MNSKSHAGSPPNSKPSIDLDAKTNDTVKPKNISDSAWEVKCVSFMYL